MSEETEAGHCWHPYEVDEFSRAPTVRLGDSGTQTRLCCYCGADGAHRYTLLRAPVPGHGPAYTEPQRVFDALPNDYCVVRIHSPADDA